MVFVRKTYAGTRSAMARIGAACMLVIGFIALVIMPSPKMPGHFFGDSDAGIAHADAPTPEACENQGSEECDCAGGCGSGAS